MTLELGIVGKRHRIEVEAHSTKRERVPHLDGDARGGIRRKMFAPHELEFIEVRGIYEVMAARNP